MNYELKKQEMEELKEKGRTLYKEFRNYVLDKAQVLNDLVAPILKDGERTDIRLCNTDIFNKRIYLEIDVYAKNNDHISIVLDFDKKKSFSFGFPIRMETHRAGDITALQLKILNAFVNEYPDKVQDFYNALDFTLIDKAYECDRKASEIGYELKDYLEAQKQAKIDTIFNHFIVDKFNEGKVVGIPRQYWHNDKSYFEKLDIKKFTDKSCLFNNGKREDLSRFKLNLIFELRKFLKEKLEGIKQDNTSKVFEDNVNLMVNNLDKIDYLLKQEFKEYDTRLEKLDKSNFNPLEYLDKEGVE